MFSRYKLAIFGASCILLNNNNSTVNPKLFRPLAVLETVRCENIVLHKMLLVHLNGTMVT